MEPKKIYEQIMTEIFPNLTNISLIIEEADQSWNSINPKKESSE